MNTAQPGLAAQWSATIRPAEHRGVGLTLINFNTATQTLRCLASLDACDEAPVWVLVLDNASEPADYQHLLAGCQGLARSALRLYRSETNLGFAAGSNFLIDRLLEEPACRFIGLINNDAVAKPAMLTRLVDALAEAPQRIGLSGGRMHKLHAPDQVDTLGICIYASLMPADRHSTDDPYLGPTGGCCMLARELVQELLKVGGYCFDARYFCYCEDTDLVLRAHLLGYEPAYVDEVVALHEGQASSGGGVSHFIAYHGLRNAIWMQIKLMPTALLRRHLPLLALAHLLSAGRYIWMGQAGLLLRIYRDAWAQRHAFLEERRGWTASTRIAPLQLRERLSHRFYRAGYWKIAWAQMAARIRPRRAPHPGSSG